MSYMKFSAHTLHQEAIEEAKDVYRRTHSHIVKNELDEMIRALTLTTGFTSNDPISSIIQKYCLQRMRREFNC